MDSGLRENDNLEFEQMKGIPAFAGMTGFCGDDNESADDNHNNYLFKICRAVL